MPSLAELLAGAGQSPLGAVGRQPYVAQNPADTLGAIGAPVAQFLAHAAGEPIRKGQGFLQTMRDYSANEFPATMGATAQSTDYDPRREAAGYAAGTAVNTVFGPGITGGVPADAFGAVMKGYHGSPHTNLSVIRANPEVRQFDNATSQLGAFLAPREGEAARYAGKSGKVYPASVDLNKPYEMPVSEFLRLQAPNKGANGQSLAPEMWAARAEELKQEGAALRKSLADAGHDGVIIRDSRGNIKEIASFSDIPTGLAPQQIPLKNNGDPILGANFTDKKTSAAILGANNDGMGIRAYHGSPHDFDRFDLSKIGTGEGAQAYGHGLYFAESEDVARSYKNALTGTSKYGNGYTVPMNLDGQPVTSMNWVKTQHEMWDKGDNVGAALAQILGDANRNNLQNLGQIKKYYKPDASGYNANIPWNNRENFDEALKQLRDRVSMAPPRGRMYEVNINAHPDQFLDLDKPLAQQSSVVQDLARKTDLSHLQPGNRTRVMLDKFKAGEEQAHYPATGHTLHNALEDYGLRPKPELSQYLKDNGIVGNTYLDGVSRGLNQPGIALLQRDLDAANLAGNTDKAAILQRELKQLQPTSNYVVFDDKLIDILKKYGIAAPMGGTAALSQLQPEPQQ